MEPRKQIDFVLFFLQKRSENGTEYSKEYILNHITLTPEMNIKKQMFEEILETLIDDGYIKKVTLDDCQPTYHLTFNDRLFKGYEDAEQKIREEKEWRKEIEVKTFKNSKQLIYLNWVIAIGTGVAAFYYSIEIFKYLFYH